MPPAIMPRVTTALPGDVRHDKDIVRKLTISRKPSDAFGLWASSEGLAQWWLPNSRIELIPGGLYNAYFERAWSMVMDLYAKHCG